MIDMALVVHQYFQRSLLPGMAPVLVLLVWVECLTIGTEMIQDRRSSIQSPDSVNLHVL